MKEPFTPEEWQVVRAMPIQAFIVVAGVDGTVDQKETKEFTDRLSRGAVGYRDPLHREIAHDLATGGLTDALQAVGTSDPAEARRLLRKHLSGEEYEQFVASVFIDCLAVANASGPRFRRKKRIGDKEQKALAATAAFWEVNLDELVRRSA